MAVEASLGRPLTAEEAEEAGTTEGWEPTTAAPVAAVGTGDGHEEGAEG